MVALEGGDHAGHVVTPVAERQYGAQRLGDDELMRADLLRVPQQQRRLAPMDNRSDVEIAQSWIHRFAA